MGTTTTPPFADEAVRYLRDLLRIDTTNPPGNEIEAVRYLAAILREADFDPQILESRPGRGNLVVRYRGTGERAPLLLYVHADVVTADPKFWTHPPFSATLANGCIWGRGALDVKSLVAQGLMMLLLLKRSGVRLRRDVIFAVTADEETGGSAGMGFLVEHHPDLIRAEYGLSEGGGTTIFLGGRSLYDIRVAEKGTCRFRVRTSGIPGHGSIPRRDTALTRIAQAVLTLTNTPLPFRALPMLDPFFQAMGEALSLPHGRRTLTAENVEYIAHLLPALGQYLHAITHDTAVPTVLRGGDKINVIPGAAELWVDGRYLPGQTADRFLADVERITGPGYEIVPEDDSPPVLESPGGPLYDTILSVMREYAPGVPVVPLLLSGATDAKHVSRLGTHCLGFGPIRVSEEFPAEQMVHGHNERIPVDGYLWGLHVLHDIVVRFCT